MSRIVLCLVAFSVVGSLSCASTSSSEKAAASTDGPELGNWAISGKGATGVNWTGTFTLRLLGSEYTGAFTWKREGVDAGTEEFSGSFDASTGKLTLVGRKVAGSLEAAKYVADVGKDSKAMLSGIWSGTSDAPGQWTATFIGK
jgi:hypothetical protein